MAIASGSFSSTFGNDWLTPLDSLASTFCVWLGIGGEWNRTDQRYSHGLPSRRPFPRSHRRRQATTAYKTMQPATGCVEPPTRPRCGPSGHARKKSQRCLPWDVQWLGHDADVGDSRLLDCVHHRGEGAKGHIFVGADKDRLMLWIANLRPQLGCDFIDVDGIVSEETRAAACRC